MKEQTYVDLTATITSNMVVFPGDPQFTMKTVNSIGDACSFNLCEMHMGNHMGTHVDFPAHVFKGGKLSNNYLIENLIGNGLILEVPMDIRTINKSFVMQQKILENDFVFFKTKNSTLSKQDPFNENYVYIEPEAAEALLEKKSSGCRDRLSKC
jgi:arylformamidase